MLRSRPLRLVGGEHSDRPVDEASVDGEVVGSEALRQRDVGESLRGEFTAASSVVAEVDHDLD